MAAHIKRGAAILTKRVGIFVLLVLAAFMFHRISIILHQQIIGALLFIAVFSVGVIYYYLNLSSRKGADRREYIVSIFFVLFLIVTMFAIIYAEPIRDGNNYFIELGKPTNLTFADAFYFSTTTVTTVGYGDIVPLGVFRLIVTVEVFMGLIYTGSMIYFLTRAFEEEEVEEIVKAENSPAQRRTARRKR